MAKTNSAIKKEIEARKEILGIDNRKNRIYIHANGRDIPIYAEICTSDLAKMNLIPIIERIENFYNIRVYCLIYNNFDELGEHLAMLYVGNDPNEWDTDREWLKKMEPMAYVYNKTYPEFSEFGTIGLEIFGAQIERIW